MVFGVVSLCFLAKMLVNIVGNLVLKLCLQSAGPVAFPEVERYCHTVVVSMMLLHMHAGCGVGMCFHGELLALVGDRFLCSHVVHFHSPCVWYSTIRCYRNRGFSILIFSRSIFSFHVNITLRH